MTPKMALIAATSGKNGQISGFAREIMVLELRIFLSGVYVPKKRPVLPLLGQKNIRARNERGCLRYHSLRSGLQSKLITKRSKYLRFCGTDTTIIEEGNAVDDRA